MFSYSVIKINEVTSIICVAHFNNNKATKAGCPPSNKQPELFHDVAICGVCIAVVYVIRISFVGRGSVCSSSQSTVGPNCKNLPTIRLKKIV